MNWILGKVVGNPLLILWIALAAFVAGGVSGGTAAWKFQGMRLDKEKAEFAGFVASTKAQGEAAKTLKAAQEAAHNRTTKEIKDAIPNQIKAARSAAVRNYIASLPVSPRGSGMSGAPNGAGGVDAASKEPAPLSCPLGFIEDAAQDAATIGQWQAWARVIGFPTK